MKVWIHINGIQEGPYELGELPLNRIKPDTPVWYEGLDYWKEASQAPEVAGYMARMAAEAAQQQAAATEVSTGTASLSEQEIDVAPLPEPLPEPAQAPESEPEQTPEAEPEQTPQSETTHDEQPYGPQVYGPQLTDRIGQQAYNQAFQGWSNPAEEEGKESPTYLVWSILLTLLCCNPIGIVAIITSIITGRRNSNYDYAGAKRMSEATAWWIMIVIVTSLIMAPFMSIIMA